MKDAYDLNIKDLKMLSTIIRIPKMCSEFQSALRQKNEAKRFEAY
jgi:hypothetical protein